MVKVKVYVNIGYDDEDYYWKTDDYEIIEVDLQELLDDNDNYLDNLVYDHLFKKYKGDTMRDVDLEVNSYEIIKKK